ncbi:hypothetical protein K402DRAFT_398434 [Aulographum hederae CBS 113979]|uniref:Uncharacterized protein n=1 Tax=Aulographum hederae CBS 113979 TaxID=1176131 RepID=A0A6G1GKS3_9PEZI|nr:hypothetical protein K402DRAFT_398434 [Aulographum hederae CBS 113979]
MRDLIRIQRVSKLFKAIVERNFKKDLFLGEVQDYPLANFPLPHWLDRNETILVQRPWRRDLNFEIMNRGVENWWIRPERRYHLHPFFGRVRIKSRDLSVAERDKVALDGRHIRVHDFLHFRSYFEGCAILFTKPRERNPFSQTGGSWRNMHISIPPSPLVNLSINVSVENAERESRLEALDCFIIVKCASGVRLRHLADVYPAFRTCLGEIRKPPWAFWGSPSTATSRQRIDPKERLVWWGISGEALYQCIEKRGWLWAE